MAKRQNLPRPVPVKEVLDKVLRPGDWRSLEQRRQIREAWERAVPAAVLPHTRLAAVRRGELWVEVQASPWIQELQFYKPAILQELARTLGPGIIREVRFTISAWED
ncbi:MAG: DUF721 domain-containing protein [Deltaproteobacteria bacterium]|nr:DUF721 domain-containing protein [Deltaproteobacteria bacterium]